jgi:hypothetical protein
MTGTMNSYTNQNESVVLENTTKTIDGDPISPDDTLNNIPPPPPNKGMHETPAPSYLLNNPKVYFHESPSQHSSKIDEEDMVSSRPSSLQESHSSRKSLNNNNNKYAK